MAIVLTCDNRGPTGSCDTCGIGDGDHCKRHPMNPTNERNVPCKWCGLKTNMLGTKECDNCHEMASRMERNPKLAQSIVDRLAPASGKCVITGVLVQVDDGNLCGYAHGDLFDGGSVWIVHRAGWINDCEPLDHSRKTIVMPQGVFELSNVMVAAKSECVLSKVALNYMQETWGSNGN